MKKLNITNPAEELISGGTGGETATAVKSVKGMGGGRRNCRLNIVITEELRDAIHLLADIDGMSINGWINETLAEKVEKRSGDVAECMELAAKKAELRKRIRGGKE